MLAPIGQLVAALHRAALHGAQARCVALTRQTVACKGESNGRTNKLESKGRSI